jgi:murein DD-endopeptidase MepM/ murein hydrolase activator NlpD
LKSNKKVQRRGSVVSSTGHSGIYSADKKFLKRISTFSAIALLVTSFSPQAFLITDDDLVGFQTEEDRRYNSQVQMSPDGFLTKNSSTSVNTEEKAEFTEHEVQDGESIQDIANDYGINVQTIVWENNIVNVDEVLPGDTLTIPPADGLSYRVKWGDTVPTIAQRYGVSNQVIDKANNVQNGRIYVNQKIFIPGAEKINQIIAATDADQNPLIEPVQEPLDPPTDNPAPIAQDPQNTVVASLNTDTPVEAIPNLPSNSKVQPKLDQDPTPDIDLPQRGELDSTNQIVVEPDPEVEYKPAVQEVSAQVINSPAVIGSADDFNIAPATVGDWGKVTEGQITNGYKAGHYALDIADRSKPPIWAARGGVIITAEYGWNGGYGNYIIIDHGDGFQTLYAHNEELYVAEGDTVTKGQVISKMGNTGRVYGATGIHVHYECVSDGVKINPHKCMSQ